MNIKALFSTLLIFGIIIVGLVNSQDIYAVTFPVKPEVTSLNITDRSSLLDYKVSVDGFVSNQGGNGDVIVTVVLRQGSDRYEKNISLSLTADAGSSFRIDFPEVRMFNGEVSCRAFVKPIGK